MSIRNNVTFQHPATFVPTAEAEGIMSIDGAAWFVDLLGRIPRPAIDPDLCQEDWGVVVFGARDRLKFWFGLSFWDEGAWLAHVHHWALLQRFRAAGKAGYAAVISDLHDVLRHDDSVSDVRWYLEADVNLRGTGGAPSPDAS
jgi:hypothetical protein